jgi:hypothetical protein
MIPNSKQYKVWFVLTVISLLIAGCAPSPDESLKHPSMADSNSEVKQSSKPLVDHHIKDQSPQNPSNEKPAKTDKPKKEASNEDVVVANEAEPEHSTPDDKVFHVTEEFDLSNPTLMGFAMNASADEVLEQFGEPLSKSFMNDDLEPLNIFEYPGFIIGFDSLDKIVFIEVNSPDVNPGLNNFRIGQTVEDARDRLGAPNSLNEYVMIYTSNDLIMKLDIDAQTNRIHSIKLFAE